jgi:hypothetical protein
MDVRTRPARARLRLGRSPPAERQRLVVLACAAFITAIYLAAALVRSRSYFWLDEVIAVSIARLPSFASIWHAIWNGAEYSPPTYEFLLHLIAPQSASHLWARVPSILAALAAAGCTYRIARLGMSRAASLVAFAAVLDSGLFQFAVEARHYALVTLCTALAFLLWQGFDGGRRNGLRAAGLWLVLSAAVSLHFYAVVTLATVALAEGLWLVTRRQWRWPAWTALFGAAATLLCWLPLARRLQTFNANDYLAPDFYAKPTVARFAASLYDVVLDKHAGTHLLVAAAAMSVIPFNRFMRKAAPWARDPGQTRAPIAAGPPATLALIMASLFCYAFIAFAFGAFVTKAYSARYIASASLFEALLVAWLVDRSAVRRLAAGVVLVVLVPELAHKVKATDRVALVVDELKAAPAGPPIVVGEAMLYMELKEAERSGAAARPLVYLARPAGVGTPDPTNENILTRFAPITSTYRIEPYADFLKANPRFDLVHRDEMSTDTTTPLLSKAGLIGRPVVTADGDHISTAGTAARPADR